MPVEAPWTQADWSSFLSAQLGAHVEVEFGRSRRYPIQVWTRPNKAGPRSWIVRLNRKIFAEAQHQVRTAVGSWMAGKDPAAARRIDQWLQRTVEVDAPPILTPAVEPEGNEHHLLDLAAPLLERSFASTFPDRPPTITWGRRVRSRGRRSLRLGSFDPGKGLVRVHPVLDQRAVPAWFVRYILFHELLHAALPTEQDVSGRWIHHPPRFRRVEQRYPDYRRALAWEALNVPRLIRSASDERPMRVLSRDRRALALDARWDPDRCPSIESGAPAEAPPRPAVSVQPEDTRLPQGQLELFPS